MDNTTQGVVQSSRESRTWRDSSEALLKLEGLLKCFLCKIVMKEPHSLSGCDHHFCRDCITCALSGSSSNCPECGQPTWVRDIKTNRQLDNLIKVVSSMKSLLSCSSEDVSYSSNTLFSRDPHSSTHSYGLTTPTSACREMSDSPHCKMGSEALKPDLVAINSRNIWADSNLEEGVFKKPRISESMIVKRMNNAPRRVALTSRMKLKLESASQNMSCSGIENGVVFPSGPKTNFECTQGVVRANVTVVGPSMSQAPVEVSEISSKQERACPSTLSSMEQSQKTSSNPVHQSRVYCLTNQNQDTHQTFGRPSRRMKRKSTGLKESIINIPMSSVEFPYSPMVTKTRAFSKLNPTGKLDRLQHSGAVRGQSGQTRAEECSGHQLTLHSFVSSISKADPCKKGDIPTPSLSGTLGPCLPSAMPTSMHARTMRRNVRGESPLHIACIKGDVSAARELLVQGADPNIKDYAGWTPLHEACNHGHTGIATVLLDHGALINIPGFENVTPLHDAVANEHVDVVKLLLERGANVTLRNCHGVEAREMVVCERMKDVFIEYSNVSGLHTSPDTFKSPHASPSLHGSPSVVVLLGTGLKGYQKRQMAEVASLLGAEVTNSFSTNVSHVVAVCNKSQCCSRTLKVLCGVATGKWIVSAQWVADCLSAQNWLDETPYEVRGVTVGNSNIVTDSPRKGRENVAQKMPGLFDGYELYLTGTFSPTQVSKEDLRQLIRLAGGKILSREPKNSFSSSCPYHLSTASRRKNMSCSTLIVYDEHHDVKSKRNCLDTAQASGVAVVPMSWLLDCLSCFELIDMC